MKRKSSTPKPKDSSKVVERTVRNIRRNSRKRYTSEEKIRMVLEGVCGDVSRSRGLSAAFYVGADETIDNVDVGLWSPTVIISKLWDDRNGDGIRQLSEPLITEPIAVQLLDRSGDSVLQEAESINGIVVFFNVPANSWVRLEYEVPFGYAHTRPDRGISDNLDSDVRRSNRQSGVFRSTRGGQTITSFDAGYWSPGRIETQTWEDWNQDGIRQFNERMLPGVLVESQYSDGAPVLDANGERVTGVSNRAGVAVLDFVPTDRRVRLLYTMPDTHILTLVSRGGNDDFDSDAFRRTGGTGLFSLKRGNQTLTSYDAGGIRR